MQVSIYMLQITQHNYLIIYWPYYPYKIQASIYDRFQIMQHIRLLALQHTIIDNWPYIL
jgi:hypothetical protein